MNKIRELILELAQIKDGKRIIQFILNKVKHIELNNLLNKTEYNGYTGIK